MPHVLYRIKYCTGQCPVTNPSIRSDVLCEATPPPSSTNEFGLRYTCNDDGPVITWSSSIISGSVNVAAAADPPTITLTVSGVSASESHTNDTACINSTLTFTGDNLPALNGATLTCRDLLINRILILSVYPYLVS